MKMMTYTCGGPSHKKRNNTQKVIQEAHKIKCCNREVTSSTRHITEFQTPKYVDIPYARAFIIIQCESMRPKTQPHNNSRTRPLTLQTYYEKMAPVELQWLVSNMKWPSDNGQMIAWALQSGTPTAASGGFVLEGMGTHAWIITSGDDSTALMGSETVDGTPIYTATFCAELQGQLSAFLLLGNITSIFNMIGGKAKSCCDNQGVVKCLKRLWKCTKLRTHNSQRVYFSMDIF